MNEKQVKERAAVCSVSGRPCKCGTQGCRPLGEPTLEPLPDEAVLEALNSRDFLRDAIGWLDLALQACPRDRQAPEFREAQRLIQAAIKLINERL